MKPKALTMISVNRSPGTNYQYIAYICFQFMDQYTIQRDSFCSKTIFILYIRALIARYCMHSLLGP